MNIATALNRKYVNYTGVMLYSLCVNNQHEHIDVYLLHSELLEEDITTIKNVVTGYDVSIIPLFIDSGLLSKQLPTTAQWSIEAYYRLFLAEMLPETVDRIIYLDVDMIVHKSLKELYEVDFGQDDLIVCADMCGVDYHQFLNGNQIRMLQPMLEQGYQYFNSGFLLMNIKKLRGTYTFSYYMKVAKEDWNLKMHAPDQDLLNYVHGNNVGYVDFGVYNLFAKIAHIYGITYDDAFEQSVIIHFAGDKPWETTDYHYDIEKIWWQYARETVLYPILLEQFMEKSISDNIVEKRIEKLKNKCNRLIEINDKLLKG